MESHIPYAYTAIKLCHQAFSRVIAIQWVYINSTVIYTYILVIYTKTCARGRETLLDSVWGFLNSIVQRFGIEFGDLDSFAATGSFSKTLYV